MKTRTAVVVWSSLAILGLLGFKAASDFRPPRTAVVDITKVFDGYLKTIDRQKTLTELSKELDKKASAMRERFRELESDIKLMQPGPERNRKKLELERVKIELDEFQRTQVQALRRDYFDRQGAHVRTLRFHDFEERDGRRFPQRWVMSSVGAPGRETRIEFESIAFDAEIDEAIFHTRNLKQPAAK